VIDLHTHSTFSDGSLTPDELAREAARCRLTAVALTDHDGTTGVPSFLESCLREGIRGIPGVEISVDFKSGTMHMLGYFLDHTSRELEEVLLRLRGGREDRNHKILERLNALGLALTWEEVATFAGEDVVGRPHFAQALMAREYVKNKDEAFDRYLGKGKAAYVDRYRLTAEASVQMIRHARGTPVLAHPFTLGLKQNALRDFVRELKGVGLEGIEAYYSEHDEDQVRMCLGMARDFDLAVSGGSDFHGAVNPDIRLGRGFGNLCVPDDLADKLHERAVRN